MTKAVDDGHIPGPVFIPNCAAIRLFWDLPNGKRATNVLHAQHTGSPPQTQTAVNALYTAVAAALTASGLAAALANTTELVGVGVRKMDNNGFGEGFAEMGSNLGATPGTGGTNALPANVSFVVTLRTGLSRQANRGRVYLPGFIEETNMAPGGIASDEAKNAAVDFIGRISNAFTSASMTLCIAHPARKSYTGSTGTSHPARSAGTVPVTSILALNNVWDSTRLRSLR